MNKIQIKSKTLSWQWRTSNDLNDKQETRKFFIFNILFLILSLPLLLFILPWNYSYKNNKEQTTDWMTDCK